MTMHTSARLEKFPEYIFSKLAKKVAEVEKITGRKVLSFGAGTPDIVPSKRYIDAFVGFIQADDAHLYPGYGAIPAFADALVEWYFSRFQVTITSRELFPLLGAKDGISHLPLALFDAGDEVLVPDPGYPAYGGPTSMIGAVPVPYRLSAEDDFTLDFEELERRVSSRTRAIWVNFPSNPTGQVVSLGTLAKIVEFARRHSLILLYDNAYSEITFDGYVAPSILKIEGAKDIVIEIGSFSKTYSFAGFRMGWVVGNAEILAALAKVKSQMDSGLSLPLQKLGAYALTHEDTQWKTEMLAQYTQRRDRIAGYLRSLGLRFSLPKGGLYIWAKIPETSVSSYEYCMELLTERHILMTPGTAFGEGGERYVRVSICVNIDNIENYF